MLHDWKAAGLLGSLDRLVGREQEVRLALERAKEDRLPERSAGLRLAARFPELEALGPLIGRSPDELRVLAKSADEAEAPFQKGEELARLVQESPYLGRALHAAYPSSFPAPRAPIIGVLLADPLVDNAGEPYRPIDQPRWRLPWRELERRLRKSVDDAKVLAEVVLRPATWEDASGLAARASVLFIVCHGNESGELAWERRESGEAHIVSPSKLREMFGEGAKPSLAVLLACHGALAAKAIHDAGVPVTAATTQDKPLRWDDALTLIDSIVGSLVAGRGPVPAIKGARAGTRDASDFEIFGSDDGSTSVPPSGVATLEGREAWVSEEPSEAFVGREKELATVWRELQKPGRLVWITGAPGMGKTELSRAVLDRAALYRWPSDGTAVVRLREARMEQDIVAELALHLGAGKEGPTLEVAARALGSSDRLIVLDNAEDVPTLELSRLAKSCLESGKAHVLVTSRDPMLTRLPEPSVRLEPNYLLAASLVRAHVEVRSPGHRWSAISRDPALRDLVKEMDGHSLSLAIAAARLALGEDPTAVLGSFRQRAGLHVPGSPADDETHVGTALAASLGSLTLQQPSAVEMWRLIADLPSGLPERANLAPEDSEDIAILLKRCLVERRFGRYDCLNPIAVWARKNLPDSSEEREGRLWTAMVHGLVTILHEVYAALGSTASRSALVVFASWIPSIDVIVDAAKSRGQGEPMAKLVVLALRCAEYAGNLALANRWAQRIADWQSGSARLVLARALVAFRIGDRLSAWSSLNQLDEAALSEREKAEANGLRGALFLFEGKLEKATHVLAEALEHYRALGDQREQAYSLLMLADVARYKYRYTQARRLLDESLILFRAGGHKLGEANVLDCLGRIAAQEAKPEEASRAFGESLSAYRAVDNRFGQAMALQSLSKLDLWEGRVSNAENHLQEALLLHRAINDKPGEANTLSALGDVAARRDALEEARSLYVKALTLARDVDDKLAQANTLCGLGDLAFRRSRLDEARPALEQALALFRSIGPNGEKLGESRTLCSLGDVALRESRPDVARRHYENALAISREIGDTLGRANALRSLGNVASRESRLDDARNVYEEALRVYMEVGEKLGESASLLSLGQLALRQNRLDEAEETLKRAAELCRTIVYRSGMASAFAALGDVARLRGQLEEARISYQTAVTLFRELGEESEEARTLAALGTLALEDNRLDEARQNLEAALPVLQAEGDKLQQARVFRALGTLALRLERLDEARTAYERALSIFRSANDSAGEASTLGPLGDIARREGRTEEARAAYEDALTGFKVLVDERGVVHAETALAEVLTESEADEARRLAIHAAGLAQTIDYPGGAVRALLVAAGTHPPDELALLHAARSISKANGLSADEAGVLRRLAFAVHGGGDESAAVAIQAAGLIKAYRAGMKLDAEEARRLEELLKSGLDDQIVAFVDRFLDDVEASLSNSTIGSGKF